MKSRFEKISYWRIINRGQYREVVLGNWKPLGSTHLGISENRR